MRVFVNRKVRVLEEPPESIVAEELLRRLPCVLPLLLFVYESICKLLVDPLSDLILLPRCDPARPLLLDLLPDLPLPVLVVLKGVSDAPDLGIKAERREEI